MEGAWRRVCREAEGHVQANVYLRDMNLGSVLLHDDRHIECLVTGLPGCAAQLAVDATLVSVLTGKGQLRLGADTKTGVALADAEKAKQRRYPELRAQDRCKLVVVGMKTAGR